MNYLELNGVRRSACREGGEGSGVCRCCGIDAYYIRRGSEIEMDIATADRTAYMCIGCAQFALRIVR
jgi:hypothetical protein